MVKTMIIAPPTNKPAPTGKFGLEAFMAEHINKPNPMAATEITISRMCALNTEESK